MCTLLYVSVERYILCSFVGVKTTRLTRQGKQAMLCNPLYRQKEVQSSSYHLSLNREDRLGDTDDFTTSFLHFSLFSTALWDLANSRAVHFPMLSSHFFCLPLLLPTFIVPCKMVFARPDERETCPYQFSLCLFTMVRRCSCSPIPCWILARTSSLVTWSLYEMRSILR